MYVKRAEINHTYDQTTALQSLKLCDQTRTRQARPVCAKQLSSQQTAKGQPMAGSGTTVNDESDVKKKQPLHTMTPRLQRVASDPDGHWLLAACVLLFAFVPLQLVAAPWFYIKMGTFHESEGNRFLAVEAYDHALAVWPRLFDAADVLFQRAVLLMSTEKAGSPRHADAEADLLALLATRPEDANLHFNLGVVLSELVDGGARAAEAEPHLRTALALAEGGEPQDRARRHEALGKLLSGLGRHEEAGLELNRALELDSSSASLYTSLANALYTKGDLKGAIAAYGSAFDQSDGMAEAEASSVYNNLAAAFQEHGELQQARRMYEKAIELSPSDHERDRARANLDKLPVSEAYRAAANLESRVLARRAAMAALAASRARRQGRPTAIVSSGSVLAAEHSSDSSDGGSSSDASPMSVRLFKALRYLRRLETEQLVEGDASEMWRSRGHDMSVAMSALDGSDAGNVDGGVASSSGGDYADGAGSAGKGTLSLRAFAWGGVWWHSAWLPACTAHAGSRAAIAHAARAGKSAVVLGSSIGFEAYFAALTFGIPTVGVELLCGLVELSNRVRLAHRVPTDVVRFDCADALKWKLPAHVGIIYVDDTAWDEPTIEQMALRLGRELPEGAVVIHNGGEAAYGQVGRLRKLHSQRVETSWSAAHEILVHIVES